MWGKQIKGREIRSGQGARSQGQGFPPREPGATRSDKSVAFPPQLHSCLPLSMKASVIHFFLPFFLFIFICACACMYNVVCMWGSEANQWSGELAHSFHHEEPMSQTVVIRLGSIFYRTISQPTPQHFLFLRQGFRERHLELAILLRMVLNPLTSSLTEPPYRPTLLVQAGSVPDPELPEHLL